MKKLINDVQDVLDEQLAGLAKAHPSLTRADALWLYRSGDAFGGLSGRNFHLTDAR